MQTLTASYALGSRALLADARGIEVRVMEVKWSLGRETPFYLVAWWHEGRRVEELVWEQELSPLDT